MNRRSYLALAAGVTFAGCTGSSGDDPDSNNSTADNETADDDVDLPPEDDGADDSGTEDEAPTAETFDDFEDLERWSVLEGTMEPDEDRVAVGSQSVHLVSAADEDRVVIAREFDSPLDTVDRVPGLALQSQELVNPVIQLFDGEGNWIAYRRAIHGGLSFQRYNFGVRQIEGSFDPSDVVEVRISLWTGEYEGEFWCDDFHFVPRPETGKVMIQFDDTHDTDYTQGLPILEEHGLEAATFVNPSRVGREGSLTLEQLEELRDAGWTVASHSMTHPHLTELDEEEREAEIVDSKEWLEENGFEDGAGYFAYPFGDYDQRTIELVEENYDMAFAGGEPAQGYAVNQYQVTRLGDPSAAEADQMLEWTAEMRGITSFFYHRLEGDLRADFEETMARIAELEAAGEIDVILPADVEDELNVF